MNKQNMIAEAGSNEIQLMEFTIAGNIFGINVAKVTEIMLVQKIKPMPKAHFAVEGVFKPRDTVITAINLPKYLGLSEQDNSDRNLFIITNFNNINVAFRVHTVDGIDNIRWSDIQRPDKTIFGGRDGLATGIAQCGNRLITILDFEKIVADISPSTTIQIAEIEKMGVRSRDEHVIVVVEDSVLLAKMITEALHKAGYVNTVQCDNGYVAFNFLQSVRDSENVYDKASLVITDIEMPVMDGHTLTTKIKEDSILKNIPVIIFSSLVNADMRKKGKEIGANEHISKPEIGSLVGLIDKLLEYKSGKPI